MFTFRTCRRLGMVIWVLALTIGAGGCSRSDADDNPAGDPNASARTRADQAPAELAAKINTASPAEGNGTLHFAKRFTQPDPAPKLPEAFDPFDPPALKLGTDGRPGFSEWTRTAGPDEHILLAGYNYPAQAGQMRFGVFAQTAEGAFKDEAKIVEMRPFQALIRLPAGAPAHAMYFVYPRSGNQVGAPAAINRAEMWYVLPKTPSPGEVCEAYGRNLSHEHSEEKAWVYLKPKDRREMGIWAEVVAVNPYKVDFVLPADLPLGQYEVWAHNGHGGRYGWAPLHARRAGTITPAYMKVVAPHRWDGPTFDITRFGADGTDQADDSEAIAKALAKARETPNATVHFPAGTFFVTRTIGPVTGPGESGIRLSGEGRDKTFIKGMGEKSPGVLMHITGGKVEIRDLVLDVNELGEKKKFYRGADRGEHNPDHYVYLKKLDTWRDKVKRWKKKKKNRGKELPPELREDQRPKMPSFPDVEARQKRVGRGKGKGVLIKKDVWKTGLVIVNCVLDAERRDIDLLKGGISDGLLDNCDIVGQEIKLGVPAFARVRNCHFFARADTGVVMYSYGGWCSSYTNNHVQDYMPNTYDTGQGRWWTVSAYGNRLENIYVGGNRSKDMTVNPLHYNQNSGEQIMWEFMKMNPPQKATAIEPDKLVFAKKLSGKVKWYSDAIIVAGKGLGQYRRVEDYDAASGTVTLSRPWDVLPDEDSLIQVGRPSRRMVVYGNYLDAKPRAYQSEDHIASAGVEPFGASLDLIVERNTFHELRTGIATFSPYMWHYYANNVFDTNRTGVMIGEGTGGVTRRNTMKNIRLFGYQTTSGDKRPAWKMEVFEHNTGTDVPLPVRLGNRYNKGVSNARITVYKNRFTHGGGEASPAIQTTDANNVIDEENVWEGYQKPSGKR